MKVKELIKKLQKQDQEAEVKMYVDIKYNEGKFVGKVKKIEMFGSTKGGGVLIKSEPVEPEDFYQ